MPLTQEQIAIIKSTVPVLVEHGFTITKLFYSTMIEENPELKNIFSKTHQETGHQPMALAGSLYAYASNIDNLGALASAVELICNKHTSLYIQPEHYNIVGTYLLATMKKVLGDALTPEIHDAWKAAYFQLADIMIAREKELYAAAGDWQDWKPMRIQRKVQETDAITSFYLESTDGTELPSWKPGQFISVRVHIKELGFAQPRQYSLSTSPGKGYFRISVKREAPAPVEGSPNAVHPPAYVSNALHNDFQEGDLIDVSHPMGDFFLEAPKAAGGCPFHQSTTNSAPEETPAEPLVLVSAGVGITPMMSMLQSELQGPTPSKRPITFLHGAPSASLRAFTADLATLRSTPGADLHTIYFNSTSEKRKADSPVDDEVEDITFTEHDGRVDLDKVKSTLEQRGLNDSKTQFFVCGPDSFMADMRRKLVGEWGIDAERVHLELFGTGGIKSQ